MNKGIALIRKWEGLKLKAYLCTSGIATIGYGATFYENGSRVKMGDIITIDRADKLLHMQVKLFADEVQRIVKVNLNENQLSALISFCFNVGGAAFGRSILAKKVNANPNDPSIRNEFMRWVNSNRKPVEGLINRRKEEANLYYAAI
jgi:lysozyme